MVTKRRNKRINFRLGLAIFFLSECKLAEIILRFPFSKSTESKFTTLVLLFYLSFLNNCFSIVNSLNDLIAVLNFHIFL